MKPRRTPTSNVVLHLDGGNEDNDLWVESYRENETELPVLRSVWELSADERAQVAAGANVELRVWGSRHPPVLVGVTHSPLGRTAP